METKKTELLLTEDDFLFLEKMILSMGYRNITRNDSSKEFLRLNLSPPRPIRGRETSYRYTNNGYTVFLHTTYLEASKKWRDKGTDAGWILIAEGDKARYFAKPFSRTKGFIMKFLRYAWVTKWKVDNRPLCPECKAYMHITKKVGTRQYYFICRNMISHKKEQPLFLPWDVGLPFNALKFLNIRREYSEKYNKKIKDGGKAVTPARKIRKTWKIGRPENLV